jgi:hypothetical protein
MSVLTTTRLKLAVLVAAVSVAPGCGTSDGLPLAPVTGKVELDGTPLAGARVEFNPVALPEKTRKGKPTISGSFAITDEKGSYSLLFGTGRRGAVVGEHSVKITTLNVIPEDPKSRHEMVPYQYNVQSQLKHTVTDGKNIADFALSSSSTVRQ